MNWNDLLSFFGRLILLNYLNWIDQSVAVEEVDEEVLQDRSWLLPLLHLGCPRDYYRWCQFTWTPREGVLRHLIALKRALSYYKALGWCFVNYQDAVHVSRRNRIDSMGKSICGTSQLSGPLAISASFSW